MSYKVVEDGLLTIIRLLANYDDNNSSNGDFRALGAGKQRVVVLQPGAIRDRSVVAAPRRIRTLWMINLNLFVSFQGEISTVAEAIRVDRQELIDQIDKYPTLNGTAGVVIAFVEGGGEPDHWVGENRSWWRQVLSISVEERATVTIAE